MKNKSTLKSFYAIVLIISVVLSLNSCGSGESTNDDEKKVPLTEVDPSVIQDVKEADRKSVV